MSLAFTKMPIDTWETLQLNAGILVDYFNPATGEFGNILGATSGGVNFATNPEYNDFGEDVDNCPPNTKQLKRLASYDPSMSGTFLTCTAATIAKLIGAADASGIKVTPRENLVDADFEELWWIGDYSDVNKGTSAGYLAIRLINALNTTGFQIQSGKDAKGTMSFEYHAHYDIANQETIPFEIYCKAGTETAGIPSIQLSKHYAVVQEDATLNLTASVKNFNGTVSWLSDTTSVVTVSDGIVTGVSEGSAVVTAKITDTNGVVYSDTCTVVVVASA